MTLLAMVVYIILTILLRDDAATGMWQRLNRAAMQFAFLCAAVGAWLALKRKAKPAQFPVIIAGLWIFIGGVACLAYLLGIRVPDATESAVHVPKLVGEALITSSLLLSAYVVGMGVWLIARE
jgi:hypothetical protein